MNYTKGEWILSEEGMTIETAHSPNGHVIATMNDVGYSVEDDAQLIAAAPDMHEALKEAADYMGVMCCPESTLRRTRKALAKAEGK